jgi:hypothetical protein
MPRYIGRFFITPFSRPIKKPTKTVRFGNQSWNTPTPLVLGAARRAIFGAI